LTQIKALSGERQRKLSMLAHYSFTPLGSDQVPLAFPLAQVVDRTLSAQRWQMFNRAIRCHRRTSTEGSVGVMGLRTINGYFIGLLMYDVRLTPRYGSTLSIGEFVLTDEGLHVSAIPVLASVGATRPSRRDHEPAAHELEDRELAAH
jgi:hypothetical protein